MLFGFGVQGFELGFGVWGIGCEVWEVEAEILRYPCILDRKFGLTTGYEPFDGFDPSPELGSRSPSLSVHPAVSVQGLNSWCEIHCVLSPNDGRTP